MPVMGRLDEQVKDVLIDPVGRRRRRDKGDAPRAPSDSTRRDAPHEDVRGVSRGADDKKSRPRTGRVKDRGREDEQLPVWLL